MVKRSYRCRFPSVFFGVLHDIRFTLQYSYGLHTTCLESDQARTLWTLSRHVIVRSSQHDVF